MLSKTSSLSANFLIFPDILLSFRAVTAVSICAFAHIGAKTQPRKQPFSYARNAPPPKAFPSQRMPSPTAQHPIAQKTPTGTNGRTSLNPETAITAARFNTPQHYKRFLSINQSIMGIFAGRYTEITNIPKTDGKTGRNTPKRKEQTINRQSVTFPNQTAPPPFHEPFPISKTPAAAQRMIPGNSR